MSVELIREYWGYHHWANRRLFDVVAALGEPAAGREVGRQFSEPTLRAMLVHMYGADWFWLETWRGRPPAIVRGDPTYGLDIRSLDDLRRRWDGSSAARWVCCSSTSRPMGPITGASWPPCSRW